ncbi:MAG: DUF456 domain-containing protein [Candidatus Omnitrophota bacterium]
MEILALVLLIFFSLIGFTAIFFTTFGTFIMLIGALLYAFLTGFVILPVKYLAVLIALYLCGEVLEYAFVIIGAKKLGASNAGVAGALFGGIIGAIVGAGFFGIGLIAGTFLGIFLGAFLVEYCIHRDLVRSLKAGTGGILGRIGSVIAKVGIAVVMLSIITSRIISSF